jgi:hypothetical protein
LRAGRQRDSNLESNKLKSTERLGWTRRKGRPERQRRKARQKKIAWLKGYL